VLRPAALAGPVGDLPAALGCIQQTVNRADQVAGVGEGEHLLSGSQKGMQSSGPVVTWMLTRDDHRALPAANSKLTGTRPATSAWIMIRVFRMIRTASLIVGNGPTTRAPWMPAQPLP